MLAVAAGVGLFGCAWLAWQHLGESKPPSPEPASAIATPSEAPTTERSNDPAESVEPPAAGFVDVAEDVGLHRVTTSGGARKRFIVDTTGAGACWLDYDGDGALDLYVVEGATVQTMNGPENRRDALYRQHDGRFEDVAEQAGIDHRAWGGGCTVGDFDNDGDSDLYITNFGRDVLYRNEGNGRFHDVTEQAGVTDQRWSAGATFFDADGDGLLDLYVAHYLDFDVASAATGCRWKSATVMCGPRGYPGVADTLYLNRGDGTFEDVSTRAGLSETAVFGLGVVAGDLDGDGDQDLIVANDSDPTSLWRNDGKGHFDDVALTAGLAFSGDGRAQAGMGIDLGDVDGDGDPDVLLTNFSDDYHTLYRNEGGMVFTDVSAAAGLDPTTRASLGWGGGFFDYDNDGDLDLFIATGHVYPEVDEGDPATTYLQANHLLDNDGTGRFHERGPDLGLGTPDAARGVAFADYDDDGDIDLAVIRDGAPPSLWRNDVPTNRGWLSVHLRGTRSNRDGIGAVLTVEHGEKRQTRQVRRSSGYYSSHDPRVHFGLGDASSVSLVVSWPSGTQQRFDDLRPGQVHEIDEDAGLVTK